MYDNIKRFNAEMNSSSAAQAADSMAKLCPTDCELGGGSSIRHELVSDGTADQLVPADIPLPGQASKKKDRSERKPS